MRDVKTDTEHPTR